MPGDAGATRNDVKGRECPNVPRDPRGVWKRLLTLRMRSRLVMKLGFGNRCLTRRSVRAECQELCGAALICIPSTWMADTFVRHPPITDSGFQFVSERRNCQKSIPPHVVDSIGHMRAFPIGAVVVWIIRSRRQFGGLHWKNVQLSSLAQPARPASPGLQPAGRRQRSTHRRPPLISQGHYDGRCLYRPPASRSTSIHQRRTLRH